MGAAAGRQCPPIYSHPCRPVLVHSTYGIQEPVGVSHADDLIYLWDPVFQVPHLELAGEDLIVSDLMATAWTEFARFGRPTTPDFPLDWEPSLPGFENRFFNISGAASAMDSSAD